MIYTIDKQALLQEDIGPIVRGGLQRYLGVNYNAKDGYKTEKDGSVSYRHPDSIEKHKPEMGTMDDYNKSLEHAGQFGRMSRDGTIGGEL